MKIIDITHTVREGMPNYPGNPKASIDTFKSESGETYLSRLEFGSHTGTHIDAPRHIGENFQPVDQLPLESLIGPCRVLDLQQVKVQITKQDLEPHKLGKGERILLKTSNTDRGFNQFFDDYIYLSDDAAKWLAKIGVSLIGIDALSIKQKGGSNIPHTALLENNIPIIEGLNLQGVEPGDYNLICLPLKIEGIDGSPVRAVLTAN